MEKFILGFIPLVMLVCAFPTFVGINYPLTGAFIAFVAICMLVYGIFSGKIKLFG